MSGSRTERSADAGRQQPGLKILLAGESWVMHTTHLKGFDAFHTTDYTEGATHFVELMRRRGHALDYIPCHEIDERFPTSPAELSAYDVVILSDVGSNTFLLRKETFLRSTVAPNRLEALARWVEDGGALLMIGGYMSFAGIDGRARYGATPLGPVLPVEQLDHDDRVELPEGFVAEIADPAHPALAGVPADWPRLLGYNRLRARPGASLLARNGDDAILTVGTHGAGRTAAFASDLAPHWAPPEFVSWSGYATLWESLLGWLGGDGGQADAGGDAAPVASAA